MKPRTRQLSSIRSVLAYEEFRLRELWGSLRSLRTGLVAGFRGSEGRCRLGGGAMAFIYREENYSLPVKR